MENIRIKLSSGRIAEIRQLTAREQMNADRCSKGDPVALIYYRTAASIVKIDDEKMPEGTSDLVLDSVIDRLTGREMDELGGAYSEAFAPNGEVIKNSPSPTPAAS